MKKIQTIVRRLPLVHWPKKKLWKACCAMRCVTQEPEVFLFGTSCVQRLSRWALQIPTHNTCYLSTVYVWLTLQICWIKKQEEYTTNSEFLRPKLTLCHTLQHKLAINPSNFHIFCHLENEKLLLMHCDKFFIHFKAIYWHLKIK